MLTITIHGSYFIYFGSLYKLMLFCLAIHDCLILGVSNIFMELLILITLSNNGLI
jgi:hypothetical protein